MILGRYFAAPPVDDDGNIMLFLLMVLRLLLLLLPAFFVPLETHVREQRNCNKEVLASTLYYGVCAKDPLNLTLELLHSLSWGELGKDLLFGH